MASCCFWFSVVRLEKTYQKCQNTLQNLPRKPFKIQVWRVILAVILELWAAPNINLYFLLFFAPFFSLSGASWSRLGRQVGAKLALKRHPKQLKNQCQKWSKFKWPSGPSWTPHFSIFLEFWCQLRGQDGPNIDPKPSQNHTYVKNYEKSKIVLSQLPGLDFQGPRALKLPSKSNFFARKTHQKIK